MKKTLGIVFFLMVFLFLLFFSFQKVNILKRDFLRLQSDYDQILKMKSSLNKTNVSLKNGDFLKEIGHIIQQFNLANKVVSIQPHGQEIEVVLQNLSQEEMVNFMRSLDQIKHLNILHADLSTNASNNLTLSLTLQAYGK